MKELKLACIVDSRHHHNMQLWMLFINEFQEFGIYDYAPDESKLG